MSGVLVRKRGHGGTWGEGRVDTEAETRLRCLQDQAQGCGTRSWRQQRGQGSSLEPLEAGLFGASGLGLLISRGDRGTPAVSPSPIGSPTNTSTGGLDTGVRSERL